LIQEKYIIYISKEFGVSSRLYIMIIKIEDSLGSVFQKKKKINVRLM
jgi:hypothetical protein